MGNDTTPYSTDVECGNSYEFSTEYWIILSFRLIFVLVFEHIVLTIKSLFAYIIPDVPTKIVVQVQRERYLARQAILQRQEDLSTHRDESPESYHDFEDRIFNDNDKPADNEEVALQPGQNLGEFEKPPPGLARVIARLSRHASSSSRGSQTGNPDNLTGHRFRAIIGRAAKERGEDADVIDEFANDLDANYHPREGSTESFHTCHQSTNTLNHAGN